MCLCYTGNSTLVERGKQGWDGNGLQGMSNAQHTTKWEQNIYHVMQQEHIKWIPYFSSLNHQ